MPRARTENMVVQELDKEILLYDLTTNKAYCLNETLAVIYEACDGKTRFDEFRGRHRLTDDVIFFALDELRREKLIDDVYVSPLKNVKRRDVIKKIGLASVAAVPVIAMLTAPKSAAAQSGCTGTMGPGPIACTRGVPGCEIDFAMTQCASCSAHAVNNDPGCPNPNFPFGCFCD